MVSKVQMATVFDWALLTLKTVIIILSCSLGRGFSSGDFKLLVMPTFTGQHKQLVDKDNVGIIITIIYCVYILAIQTVDPQLRKNLQLSIHHSIRHR